MAWSRLEVLLLITRSRGQVRRVILGVARKGSKIARKKTRVIARRDLLAEDELTGLSRRDLEEVHAYLVRLKHDAGRWKRATAQRIRDMRKGKGVTSEQIEARLRRQA